MEYLLDLDLMSFDKLMDRSREVRGMRLMEEARIMHVAVGSAFGGDGKAMDEMAKAYMPGDLRERDEREKIKSSARQLNKLFGG